MPSVLEDLGGGGGYWSNRWLIFRKRFCGSWS